MISENGDKVVRGMLECGYVDYGEMSDCMGVIVKKVYEKEGDFVEVRRVLGKKRVE